MMHRRGRALGPDFMCYLTQAVGMAPVHTWNDRQKCAHRPRGSQKPRSIEKKKRPHNMYRTVGTIEEAVVKNVAGCGQRYGARGQTNTSPHRTPSGCRGGLSSVCGRQIVCCAYDPHSTRCCCCCCALSTSTPWPCLTR